MADIEVRIIGRDDFPIKIGSVSLYPNQQLSVSNGIAVKLPSQPINAGDGFKAIVYGHATYAVATFSLLCSVSDLLQITSVNINDEKWLSEVRNDNNVSMSVVAILKEPDLAVFDESKEIEELFAINLLLDAVALPEDSATIECIINYLSNVLNEKVLPVNILALPNAVMFDYDTTNDPYVGEIQVSNNSAVGLVSYTSQVQLINIAFISGIKQTFPISHYLALSNGELEETTDIKCNTDSKAFSLSSNCLSVELNGTEKTGASQAMITTTHLGLTARLYLRVWYPYNGAELSVSPETVYPVKEAFVRNGSNDCVQRWEEGQLYLFVEYAYSTEDSPSRVISLLPYVVGSLSVSEGLGSVDANGIIVPTASGHITISAGPNIIPVSINASDTPQGIQSLSLTLLSGISLTLPTDTQPITDNFLGSVMLEQSFDSISSQVYFIASAILEDGKTVLVTYKDGLRLESLNESVIRVSGDGESLSVIGTGKGELVSAKWISQCGSEVLLEEGVGYGSVSVPDPVGIELTSTSSKVTYEGDYADLAGIPVSVNVTVRLKYPDNYSRNVVSDSSLNITIFPPDGGSVTFNKMDEVLTLSLDSDEGFGDIIVQADYNEGQFKEELVITSVGYSFLSLTATPYPSYNNSDQTVITTLYRLYPTQKYQEAQLNFNMILSDNSSYSITDSNLASFSTLSTIITPGEAGNITVSGNFGSISDTAVLNIMVTDDVVVVSSVDWVYIGFDTLSGIINEATVQMQVSVTFNDSRQYPRFVPDGVVDYENVLTLESSDDAAAVDSSGLVSLRGNHYDIVYITVSAAGSEASGSVGFACNLEPDIGDVDIGSENGVPVSSVIVDSEISIPLRINVGNSILEDVEISLVYDNSLEAENVVQGSDWSGKITFSQYKGSKLNTLKITGQDGSSSGVLEFVILQMSTVSHGIAEISGIVQKLVNTNQNIIGMGSPMIAGAVSVNIQGMQKRRSVHLARLKREADQCDLGDVDDNCIFDESDIQYLLSQLSANALNASDYSLPSDLDIDRNSFIDPSDAYYLHRVYANLSYILEDLTTTPASLETNCVLEINATILSGTDSFPQGDKTVVFFDLGLPTDFSFVQQNQLDDSFFYQGSLILSPKSLLLHGGIIQAQQTHPGIFSVSMATNLTSSNIGLSVIIVTASSDNDSVVSPGRVQVFHGSPYSPFQYTYPLDVELNVFSNNVPLMAQNGYNPFNVIDNSLAATECESFVIAKFSLSNYIVSIPEDTTVGKVLVTVRLSVGSLQDSVLEITAGNLGSTFSLLQNGSLVLSKLLDYEAATDYVLTVTSSETVNQTIASTVITVNVTDVNDNSPLIAPVTPILFASNLPVGTVVADINATDEDSSDNGMLQYSILLDDFSLFYIHPLTGEVILNTTINITEDLMYSVTFGVKDLGTPSRESDIQVNVTITLYLAPYIEFTERRYSANVTENVQTGTYVVMLDVNVFNSEANAQFNYTLLATPNLPFAIDGEGVVTVSGPIDREAKDSYILDVQVKTAIGLDILSSSTSVSISVLDENDNHPKLDISPYNLTLLESVSVPRVLDLNISASDKDAGSNSVIMYSIAQDYDGQFTVDSKNGQVSLVKPLDYEASPLVEFIVFAADNGSPSLSSNASIAITVVDVNDNPPQLELSPQSVTVNRSIPIGKVLASVAITDEDNSYLNGQTNVQIDSEYFNITDDFTQIYVAKPLTNITMRMLNVSITATDLSKPSLTSVSFLLVLLEDDGLGGPRFISNHFSYTLKENIPENTTVANLSSLVTTFYTDIQQNLEFFLTNGGEDIFEVDDNGVLLVIGSLDYENRTGYLISVLVKDADDIDLPGSMATINITVIDVNDNAPVITADRENVTISAASQVGSVIVNLQVTDVDSNKNAEVTLSLSGDTYAFILVDNEVRLNKTLDLEEEAVYKLTVIATDNGLPSLSSSLQIIITINSLVIEFDRSAYAGNIFENTPPGTAVINVTATVNMPFEIHYQFSESTEEKYGNLFSINNMTGIVSTAASLDFEEEEYFVLTVKALAVVSDKRLVVTSTNITITVLDVNDNGPYFIDDQFDFELQENFTVGETIVNLTTLIKDDDSLSPDVTFMFLNNVTVFGITGDDELYVNNQLDYEAVTSYHLVILVRDLENANLPSNSSIFNITVTDINDNIPSITASNSTVTISSATKVGTVISQVFTSDSDSGNNGIVDLSLYGDAGFWTLENHTIVLKEELNIGEEISFLLNVTATDRGRPSLSSSLLITVHVEPVVVMFNNKVYRGNITENDHLLGVPLVTVSANASVDGQIMYSLSNKTNVEYGDLFSVENLSGEVLNLAVLDFEVEQVYELLVEATVTINGQSVVANTTVTISVIDVNDNPPVFEVMFDGVDVPKEDDGFYSISPQEEVVVNVSLVVTDLDSLDNSLVEFQVLSGSDSQHFTLNSMTLNSVSVLSNGLLDRETQEVYNVSIEAVNKGFGGILTSTATLLITILDVNDNAPVFSQASYSVFLIAPIREGTVIIDVNATDLDTGMNGMIKYSLLEVDSLFDIDPNTGILETIKAIPTHNNFSIIVIATDSSTLSPRSESATVTLTVSDLIAGRENDFKLTADTALGLIGQLQSINSSSYSSKYGFVLPTSIRDSQILSVSLGSVAASATITPSLRQPNSLNCLLVNQETWEDERLVFIAAQVKDKRNNVQTLPTSIFVKVSHFTEGVINSTASVDTITGTASTAVQLPMSWFSNDSAVSVSCGLDDKNVQNIGTVSIRRRPTFTFETSSYVYMELPLSPQSLGDNFEILIYAESGHMAVGTYALQMNCSDQFQILNVTVDSRVWTMVSKTLKNDTDILFTGLIVDPSTIPQPGRVLLATVIASSNANTPQDKAFTLTIHFLGTVDKEKILPPPGADSLTANASTYLGLQLTGAVAARSNQPIALFVFATTTDILNTAVLDGVDVEIPLTVLGILPSGDIVQLVEDLTCFVSAQAAMQVSQDCTTLLVTSSHSVPAKNATVTVETLTGVAGLLTLSIWTPVFPGSLTVLDSTLNLVSKWVINPMEQGCTQQYQRTRVNVFTNFTDSIDVIENVITTHLVSFSQDNSSILIVNDDATVTGISPGMTTIRAQSKDGSKIVGEFEVIVSSDEVQIQGLDMQIVTSLSITPENASFDSLTASEFTVTSNQDFDFVGSQGTAVVSALYSDGHRNIIDISDGLSLLSLDESVVKLTNDLVTIVSNGSGVLLKAEWVAASCGDQVISTGNGFISLVLPHPEELEIILDTRTLVATQSIGSQIGVPTSATIREVRVKFRNGQSVNILDSPNTQFSLLKPNQGVVLNITDAKMILVQVDADPGTHTLLVSSADYPGLNSSVDINVVQVQDVNISARPYPVYTNSETVVISELRGIASSGLYQQAVFRADAVLSNGDIQDVSTNAHLQVSIASQDSGIESDILETDDGFVVNLTKVDNSGGLNVTATLLSVVSSAQYSFIVSTELVHLTNISITPLTNDTLSGTLGTVQQIELTASFSDGSIIKNLFKDISIPNVVTFEASPQQNAMTVDKDTGTATLMGNSQSTVSITAKSTENPTVSATIEFYCNLEPELGDVDLGNTASGPPITDQTKGVEFILPLYVNSKDASLDFIELTLNFDQLVLKVVEVNKGPHWPSNGLFGYTIEDPEGSLFIGGTFGSSNSPTESLIHIADITFLAISMGKTFLNGTINNLMDSNNLHIGRESPKPIIAGATEVVVKDNSRKKRQVLQQECGGTAEAGDVDGDCVFDARDVAYLQYYYLDLLAGTEGNVSSQAAAYLDCDKSGVVDPNDVLFMSRVAFNLYRFVDNFQLFTVMEEKCFLNLTITSTGANNVPAQPDSTFFLAFFTHSHPDFRSQFNQTNFTIGTVLKTSEDGYIGVVLAEHSGTGSFSIMADASILVDEVGVSIIQVTFNSKGETSESRMAILTQEALKSDLFLAFNFTVTIDNSRVLTQRQLPYTPLKLFNNTLTTEDCIALMAPVRFNQSKYTVTVLEGTAIGTNVLRVGATVGHYDAVISFSLDTFSILKYNTFPFELDTVTGIISVAGKLDHEGTSTYAFILYATENRTLTNDSTIVEVIIANINDLIPVFDQIINTTIFVPASATEGFFVIQINATDPDMLDMIFYSITSSTIDNIFTINNTSGMIQVNSAILFLNNTNFLLGVTAADSQFNSSILLNLFIFLPFFTQNTYQAVLPENTTVNSTIQEISIENTFTDTFTFSLHPSYEFFSIGSDGIVMLVKELDYESAHGNLYNLTIQAISEHFNISATLIILVTDINDNPPRFSADEYSIIIHSYLPLGTLLDIINVTDADSEQHAMLQYSLRDSEDSKYFDINSNGTFVITSSLLNSPKEVLMIEVLVHDNVHTVNGSVNVTLLFQEIGFPGAPLFTTSMNTLLTGSPSVLEGTNTSVLQTFVLLPGVERTVLLDLGSAADTAVDIGPLLQHPVNFTVYPLLNHNEIYPHQNKVILAAQVRDLNFFTATTPGNISVIFSHSKGEVESSCTPDPIRGICLLETSLPYNWFESESVVNWTAALDYQPESAQSSSLLLKTPEELTQQLNNSVVVILPPGPFLAGDFIQAEVYGKTTHVLAGFSILFAIDPLLQVTSITFNSTYWSMTTESNGSSYSVLGILSSPSSETASATDYTSLFTLHLRVSQQLAINRDCLLSGTVISLVDSVEGSVLVDASQDSRSGPVYFHNLTGLHTSGHVTTLANQVIALLPYVAQPVLFNTAVLSGIPVQVPVELWAGYLSGDLSLYSDAVSSCESSDISILRISSDCSLLILTGVEVVGKSEVTVTFDVAGIVGVLAVQVYYPALPFTVTLSDSTLSAVQMSLSGNCEAGYQQASLKAFADFSTNSSVITDVDITSYVLPFFTSSNQEAVVFNGNSGTVTGNSVGNSTICANTFNGNNPSCMNITAVNDPVFIVGLSVAIFQSAEVSVFQAGEEDFTYNITIDLVSDVQNISAVIVSLQYNDGENELVQSQDLLFQSGDTEVFTVNTIGEIMALKDGQANLSVTWRGPGVNCELEVVKLVPISVSMRKPARVLVMPSQNETHRLTSDIDPSTLMGVESSYEIVVLLEYSDGLVIKPSSLSYNISNSLLAQMDGDTIRGQSTTGLVQLAITIVNLNITITLEFMVVRTVSVVITSSPYPAFPGSETITKDILARVDNTTHWQQSQLGLRVTQSDGYIIEATQMVEGDLFVATTSSKSISVTVENNVLTVTPLNGVESSGDITINPVIPQLSGIQTSISVVNNPVSVVSMSVQDLPNNTLSGVAGNRSYQLDISIILQDNTSISNILSVSSEFNNILKLSTSSESISTSSNGYLIPLLNTGTLQSVTVSVLNSFTQELTFYVNLDADIGGIDVGNEIGPPLNPVAVGDEVDMPLYINTGNEDLGNIELSFSYNSAIFRVSDVTLGGDWTNGMYHFGTGTPGLVLFTSVFPDKGISGGRLHICTITLRTLAGASSSSLVSTEVTSLGFHGENQDMVTGHSNTASSVSISILGTSKRDVSKLPVRFKRNEVESSGCTMPPCDCTSSVMGDTNIDCEFSSADVLNLLNYLKENSMNYSKTVQQSTVLDENAMSLDVTLDQTIDVNDAYVLFRALIGLIPFIDKIEFTPVQSPESGCLFSVNIALSGNSNNNDVYLHISLPNGLQQANLVSSELKVGQLVANQSTNGMYGGLLKATRLSGNGYVVKLNTSLTGRVGVSVIAQSFDTNNQTSASRTVQYFGPPPLTVQSWLLYDIGTLYVFISSGYSSFKTVDNEIQSNECSDFPLISDSVDIIFQSPYNATVVWELDNLRSGLNLSSLIFVRITECALDQDSQTTSCHELDTVPAESNTTASLMTHPFTLYVVTVVGPNTESNETSEISPEDSK